MERSQDEMMNSSDSVRDSQGKLHCIATRRRRGHQVVRGPGARGGAHHKHVALLLTHYIP